MAITTLSGLIAGLKERIQFCKTATRTVVQLVPFSVFDIAGSPGAGVLAGTSTANGVIPTDATLGCPTINFGSGVGYLTKVEWTTAGTQKLQLYDMVFKAGAYGFAAGTTSLSSQPAISGRCPDYPGSGTVFGNGMQIWIEVTTAFSTGTAWQVQITYTNSAGTAGRTSIISVAQAAAGLTLGKMFQIALQAGDSGVQKIESVIVTNGGTPMVAGNFNVLILRSLWSNYGNFNNAKDIDDILKVGMPIIYNDSAIIGQLTANVTSLSTFDLSLEISSG